MTSDRFEKRAAEWDFSPRITAMFRSFVDLFRSEIDLHESMELLDVGGGTGLIAFDLAESVQSVTIVDSSPAMMNRARERKESEGADHIELIESDVVHADFGTVQFDGVYGHMSFHHIESIDTAFDRISSVIKRGGFLVIADLLTEDGSFHAAEPVPHNGFNTVDLTAKLMLRGFRSIRTVPLSSVDRPETGRSYERFFLIARK